MKQKLYILTILDALVILTGTIFKIEHFPGAGILLSLGIGALIIVVLPLALADNYKGSENASGPFLHIITWVTCFVVFGAMLFKIQHWPGAGIALMIALPFPYVVFLPAYIYVTSRRPGYNIYNTVFVLMLLAVNSVFSALLALNASLTRITDSYNIALNYNRIELAINSPVAADNASISLKIDNILQTIDEYQAVLLKNEGLSEEQWNKEPVLLRPDSRVAAYIALEDAGYMKTGNKLEQQLRDLISALKATPELQQLADAAMPIFSLEPAENNYFKSLAGITLNNPLTWSLTWFDSLETNLKLLKIAVL